METIDYAHPTEELLRTIDVHTVLPQQEPFVMIGVMTHFELTTSTTQTPIREDNVLVSDGCLSASGMMENIAQTCASRIGYYNKYVLHNAVQVGFIGAIRNYEILQLPPVGAVITTRVDILEEVFGMTLAHATVTFDGKTAATAEIKLAVRTTGEPG